MRLLRSIVIVVALLLAQSVLASGCIVVRPTAPLAIGLDNAHDAHGGQWEYTVAYRYLFSDRHFRGTHEEPERQENESDVRNSVHTLDHSLTYWYDQRWRFSASLPVVFARRSSLYEHDRVNRSTMQANGIGDLRLMAYREMIIPEEGEPLRGITLGVGIKLPTGKDDVTDIANRPTGPEVRTVDQSIQPGDGGTGVLLELTAYRQFFDESTFAFFTASYLINPRNTSGVPTFRGRESEAIMSVPDTYLVRTGMTRVLSFDKGISGDLAVRVEGVPSTDLIGGSDGFRRPGYAVYLEPGLNFQRGVHRFSFSLPWTIHQHRVRSQSDRLVGGHGDAAFADWLLQMSYGYRW